jgi:hypothetical protein
MELSVASTNIEPKHEEPDSEDSFKAVTRHQKRTKKITRNKSVAFQTITPHDNCPKVIPTKTASQKRHQERISATQSNHPDPEGKSPTRLCTPTNILENSNSRKIHGHSPNNLVQLLQYPAGLPKEITVYNGRHPSNNVDDFLPDLIILSNDTYIRSMMILNLMSIITSEHPPFPIVYDLCSNKSQQESFGR